MPAQIGAHDRAASIPRMCGQYILLAAASEAPAVRIWSGGALDARSVARPSPRRSLSMFAFHLTRRAALVAFVAVAAPSAAIAADPRRSRVRPRRRRAGRRRARCSRTPANRPQDGSRDVARRDRAGARRRRDRPGRPVSVRIDYVILGPNSGGVRSRRLVARPDGRRSDQGRGRAAAARAHLLLLRRRRTRRCSSSRTIDRVAQLCQAFACWVARATEPIGFVRRPRGRPRRRPRRPPRRPAPCRPPRP